MSKSNSTRGSGRQSGTVTVIEQQVHRSSQRNARFAFVITAITVGLVALVVAKESMHPILAVLVAAPIAFAVGGMVWVLVRIWPVLRAIWWWTPEISLTVLTAWAWTVLAMNTPPLLTLAVLAVVVGVPAAVAPVRRWVVALFWCLVVRHRLRICFAQFIVANKSGSLPLVGFAWPTPVGERVWVMLRPGLSLEDLAQRLDKIAVACHATSVLVDRSGSSDSAFVRFDIKRREVLTATVNSPLVDYIAPVPAVDGKEPATVTGLDLPDVPDEPTRVPAASAAANPNGRKSSTPSKPAADDGDDINDWI